MDWFSGGGGDDAKKEEPAKSSNDDAAEQLKKKEEAIRKLLEHLATQQVDLPDELRDALIGKENAKQLDEEESGKPPSLLSELLSSRASEMARMDEDELVKEVRVIKEKLWGNDVKPFECRVIDGSFKVKTRYEQDVHLPKLSGMSGYISGQAQPEEEEAAVEEEPAAPPRATQKIETVATASPLSKIFGRCFKTVWTRGNVMKEEEKVIMDGVNLHFEAGKMYLVLGLPGSGKSTLLKMIAKTLRQDKNHVVGGEVKVNGLSTKDENIHWPNVSLHIDQIDRLHPYLTVRETIKFAWQCRQGGSHVPKSFETDDPELQELVKSLDEEKWAVAKVLDGLGLTRVKDTFVGDQTTVRGVSGGEKKRVTVAELLVTRIPVACCDEISTGLDAATTYDIIKLISQLTEMMGGIRIVSLLQPPPETVALFDELVLVNAGLVIYAGPVDGVVSHFESLGYKLPDRTDVADWLLALPTKSGARFLVDDNSKHLTTAEFKERFDETDLAQAARTKNEGPLDTNKELGDQQMKYFHVKYRNPWYRSLQLLVRREMLLWWRDKYQIKARLAQDVIMGVVAGTVFWQQSDDPQSVMGIVFQSMFYISVGAMLKIPAQFEPRSIFYKHQDANFFPTWTFVAGRSLAGVPTSVIDALVYGSFVYWFVGLSSSDGPAAFFKFLLLVLTASLSSGLIFSMFSATVRDKSTAQACMSIAIVLMVLFSGFTVQPDVIPGYWIWAYWINMFAWTLRSLVVNEYTTSKYDELQENGLTAGENILSRFGFIDGDGEAFTGEWVWWGVLFAIGAGLFSVIGSSIFLAILRFETGKSLGTDIPDVPEEVDVEEVEIPFQKVNLTMKDMHYYVKASTSNEELELLKGIDGFVESGKMTALMGSSGAGKTTLMDCLSLRKTTGTITGDVKLNGHPQEPASFRRCTGYVEQFDVQSPALTIRETIDFSARLRLEETDAAVTAESINKFVDQTLAMLELTVIQDLQVGSDSTGGLSFEQRKRLSIAVELVANPSILFLDEPTSGLDARAAGIVMRGLKRIALTGRAVCATIHQPSIAIFNEFDSLLLLKRGGEVVYFGELGDESSTLIEYLERYDATPKIQAGENPATWMLTCIGAGSSSQGGDPFDYVGAFRKSKLREVAISKIEEFDSQKTDDNEITFPNEYAASTRTQLDVVMKRVMQIYWRSPSYNTVRLTVSAIVALLFGSVYASQRVPTNESDMNSRVTSIFITFLFLAVNSFNTVLAVFEIERNMFYRHKAALMYNTRAIVKALSVAEVPFVLLSSMIFCVCFYFLVGFSSLAYKFFLYYLFFTLNLCAFTFLGQMMVSLVRDSQTAQGFGGLLIAMTSIFSGVLIRPDNIQGFWTFAYWLFPGHYVLEGLVASQFHEDDTPIESTPGSPFYQYLVSERGCTTSECIGTAEDWIFVSFGGQFKYENIPWNVLYLVALIFVARAITFYALMKLNYLAK